MTEEMINHVFMTVIIFVLTTKMFGFLLFFVITTRFYFNETPCFHFADGRSKRFRVSSFPRRKRYYVGII